MWRGKLFDKRWLMWVFVVAVVPAVIANQAGWIAAEVGRQPWVVQAHVVRGADGEPVLDDEGYLRYEEATVRYTGEDGVERSIIRSAGLRTDQGISEAVRQEQVVFSIVLFGLIYALLTAVWIVVLNSKIQKGPEPLEPPGDGGFLDAASARLGEDGSMTGRQEE
jgi:cytochrome d ubiquinol oxidase subunit I